MDFSAHVDGVYCTLYLGIAMRLARVQVLDPTRARLPRRPRRSGSKRAGISVVAGRRSPRSSRYCVVAVTSTARATVPAWYLDIDVQLPPVETFRGFPAFKIAWARASQQYPFSRSTRFRDQAGFCSPSGTRALCPRPFEDGKKQRVFSRACGALPFLYRTRFSPWYQRTRASATPPERVGSQG